MSALRESGHACGDHILRPHQDAPRLEAPYPVVETSKTRTAWRVLYARLASAPILARPQPRCTMCSSRVDRAIQAPISGRQIGAASG
jgi:hypothetical protein